MQTKYDRLLFSKYTVVLVSTCQLVSIPKFVFSFFFFIKKRNIVYFLGPNFGMLHYVKLFAHSKLVTNARKSNPIRRAAATPATPALRSGALGARRIYRDAHSVGADESGNDKRLANQSPNVQMSFEKHGVFCLSWVECCFPMF